MKRLFWPALHLVSVFAMYFEGAVFLGLAATPGALLVHAFWTAALPFPLPFPAKIAASCVLAALGYFIFGLVLCVEVLIVRNVLFMSVPVGSWPYYSPRTILWANYNALILFVRFTFMNFLKVTPLLPVFYRAMGAKVGRGVHINSLMVSDFNLLTLGDGAVIGGDATIAGHIAEGGKLTCAPVVIGRKAMIGIMAVVMPGVEIGDGAVVAANAVVLKNTKIPPGEVWGGTPAKKIGETRH